MAVASSADKGCTGKQLCMHESACTQWHLECEIITATVEGSWCCVYILWNAHLCWYLHLIWTLQKMKKEWFLFFFNLIHDGRFPSQAIIRKPKAAPLAAIIRLRLDKLLAVSFLLLLLFLSPLLLPVTPLFGALGAEFGHLRGTAWQMPSSVVLHSILWHCACRGCHSSSLQITIK